MHPYTVGSESRALKVFFAIVNSVLGTVPVEDAQKTYLEQMSACIQATEKSVWGKLMTSALFHSEDLADLAKFLRTNKKNRERQIRVSYGLYWASLVAQMINNLAAVQETQV